MVTLTASMLKTIALCGAILGGGMAESAYASMPIVQAENPAAATCPKQHTCLWTEPNLTGRHHFSDPRPGKCSRYRRGNSTSNQTTRTVRHYSKPHCKGKYFDLAPGHHTTNTPFPVKSIRQF